MQKPTFSAFITRGPHGDVLSIQAMHYGLIYEGVIGDFTACQQPAALLTSEACKDFMFRNTASAKYSFADNDRKLKLEFEVPGINVTIPITLVYRETEVKNLQMELAKLKKEVDRLDNEVNFLRGCAMRC